MKYDLPRMLMVFFSGLLLGLFTMGIAAQWLLDGEDISGVILDEDCSYQIEYVDPSRFQRILHFSMRDPGSARLIRIADGKTVANSGIVDFFGGNGQVIWLIKAYGRVVVGRDISFTNIPVSNSYCSIINSHFSD